MTTNSSNKVKNLNEEQTVLAEYDLPSKKYRPVDPDNWQSIVQWHGFENSITDENTGSIYPEDFEDEHNKKMIRAYSKYFTRYFLIYQNKIAGIFAIPSYESISSGSRSLMVIEGLYILPEYRNMSFSKLILQDIYNLACSINMAGIRLQTEYQWKSAVNFYLHNGYWLLHWNDGLNFVRMKSLPDYKVVESDSWLKLYVQNDRSYFPLISVRNDGDCLHWIEHEWGEKNEDLRVTAETTLSLHLAIRGWPLVRAGEYKVTHGDCGGPEAFATQLAFWKTPMNEM
ncbi:hypothetical protein GCM10023116_15500 [Kistimonas scapharcae]|uniref:N-acetyltransferase domain-containing protein n=1 Tax=Kistimonas scapharcae TaxID=1036133 RepID=A0ABP8V0F6_9GAMM